MLDNGYVYLAATRLSLHRSAQDWALAIEVFGYSPRSYRPDLHVYTFGSKLHDRKGPDEFVTPEAHEKYLEINPNNESRFWFPFDDDSWVDEEWVNPSTTEITLRSRPVPVPGADGLKQHGIELADPPRLGIPELCRYLAATHRDDVLATPSERRASVPPELEELLVLDEWAHPDLVNGENQAKPKPSRS